MEPDLKEKERELEGNQEIVSGTMPKSENRNEYQRKYRRERYHTDTEFREKMLESARKCNRKKYAAGETWQQKNREAYRKRQRKYMRIWRKNLMGCIEILDFLENNRAGKFDYLEIHKGVNDAGYSVGVSSVQHVLMGLRRRKEVNTEVIKRERSGKGGMVRVMLHFHKEPVKDVHIHSKNPYPFLEHDDEDEDND